MITCKTCGKYIGKSPMRGTNIQLYDAVVCTKCGSIECMDCKQSKGALNSPCSYCKGEVSPAFENLVR